MANEKIGSLYYSLGLDDSDFDLKFKNKVKKMQDTGVSVGVSLNTDAAMSQFGRLVEYSKNKSATIDLTPNIDKLVGKLRTVRGEMDVLKNMHLGEKGLSASGELAYTKEFDKARVAAEKLMSQIKTLESVQVGLNKSSRVDYSGGYYKISDERTLKSMSVYYKELERETAAIAKNNALITKETEKQNAASKRQQAKDNKAEILAYKFAQEKASDAVDRHNISQKRLDSSMALSNKTILNARQAALQLSNQLGTMFSIYAVERFVKKLAEVRGQFEMSQISLRAILQDAPAADKIFEQVKALSVQSPFTFKNLVDYHSF